MWLGVLFAMLCVATWYEHFDRAESATVFLEQSTAGLRKLISVYREKTIQCLVLGNYIEVSPYTIETLLLHLYFECVRGEETQTGSWVMLGLLIRLALQAGYHIDGSHNQHTSPFRAELRRRTWMMIFMADVFTSAQMTLPRMIKDSQCDTASPLNLLDEDIAEDMVELPDARPESVQTSVLYFEAKSRIVRIYGMAYEMTSCTPASSYEEIMAVDKLLHATYRALPQWLAMRPIAQSTMESSEQIMRPLYIGLVFLRARCALHRNNMLKARTDPNFTYSHVTCTEAAIRILEIQQELDREMQIGGLLYQDRWKVVLKVKHDFLFATTLLCLELDHALSTVAGAHTPPANVVKILKESYSVWLRSSSSSKEAQEAIEILRDVFEKVQMPESGSVQGLEGQVADGHDESILVRPKPINFLPTNRFSRGPMIFPRRD